jgi:AdoMet-dependent rRNA methyltransferase SPB1
MPRHSRKTAKGRLDKFYYLAKEQGYRARSAFKLIQLNRKYQLLENARVVVDLCAAPGSWLQVASKAMPQSHLIIGVDLVPIRPIPGVITLKGDITTVECKHAIQKELKDWKVDVVLHDGAPNVGADWDKDAYVQVELVLHALKLATSLLCPGGTFVTKIFRSKDYSAMLWVLKQLFQQVETTKPSSSRTVSAELFIICRHYLAPKRIDPKLLDPRYVFQDGSTTSGPSSGFDGSNDADEETKVAAPVEHPLNIYCPEKTTRHREGYADGVTILFKAATVGQFINATNPVPLLATCNEIKWAKKDINNSAATVAPDKDPLSLEDLALLSKNTNKETMECMKDLKVLAKREFKLLLKWRLEMRKLLGLEPSEKDSQKVEEKKEANEGEQVVSISAFDEEAQVQNDTNELEELLSFQKKREKSKNKRALIRKAKQVKRMAAAYGEGEELGKVPISDLYDQELFRLGSNSKTSLPNEILEREIANIEPEIVEDLADPKNNSVDLDLSLDDQLESMYQEFREQRKGQHKPNKKEFSDSESESGSKDQDAVLDSRLENSLVSKNEELSQTMDKVDRIFSRQIFKSIEEMSQRGKSKFSKEDDDSDEDKKQSKKKKGVTMAKGGLKLVPSDSIPEPPLEKHPKSSMHISKDKSISDSDSDSASDMEDEFSEKQKEFLYTPEGMALALELRKGKKSAKELAEDSFNRYAFPEAPSELPSWFREEESMHNTAPVMRQESVTRESVQAINSKMSSIQSKPNKKALEAKMRKKMRAYRHIQAFQAKASSVMDNSDLTEGQKSNQVQTMLRNAMKRANKKNKTTLVVARGSSKGKKGRPKGVKGRYKMVDSRMKKDKKKKIRGKR